MSDEVRWSHKDVWTQRGQNFTVEISRHERPARDGMGVHRWAVYAYVYPSHPHFAQFVRGGPMSQDAASDMPLHGGPSYLRCHFGDDGTVTSWQVGADYNHLHDDHFTHEAVMPPEVHRDAERLFAWLEQRTTKTEPERAVSP